MPLCGRQSSPSVTYLLDHPAEREKDQSLSVEGIMACCTSAREDMDLAATSSPRKCFLSS